jgi:two-component system, NarL family, sensor kinase
MPTDQVSPLDTAFDLRRLYREAEARAARLKVLVDAGRALASARGTDLDGAATQAARQAALLLGYADGHIAEPSRTFKDDAGRTLVLPLVPSGGGRPTAELVLVRRASNSQPDPADVEAVAVLRQLLGGALAARAREAHLQTLLSQLLVAQERERAHVARELHDGVAQVAAAALRRIELASTSLDPQDAARAVELQRMAVSELRRVIAGMRPTILDDLGLEPALQQIAAALTEYGFEVQVSVDLPTRLPPHLEAGLFRLAQESLNNARAHAGQGCRIDVELRLLADRGELNLQICDDGCGFDPERNSRPDGREHVGLAFMAERVATLGGTFRLESAPGRGTTISVTVPYP